jgi:acyl carrier protein phosphodiesterase
MNYLAHVLLAEPTPESRLGNVAADCLRHPDLATLPPAVLRGVMQHRQVDAFTDRHPVVHRAIARLSDRWGWFKGILIDVYFDHLLASGWAAYCPVPLRQFVFEVNADLLAVVNCLPAGAAETVRWLAGTDRLATYAERAGIEAALARVTHILKRRIPGRAVDLAEAMPELATLHDDLTADFAEFFPQLQQVSAG